MTRKRLPWAIALAAAYRWNERLSTSIAARYSGRQFRTLNNSWNFHPYPQRSYSAELKYDL